MDNQHPGIQYLNKIHEQITNNLHNVSIQDAEDSDTYFVDELSALCDRYVSLVNILTKEARRAFRH